MKNISVIGELLFDIYPSQSRIGGAPFNFTYHINKLYGGGDLVSRIGQDEFGKSALAFMKTSKINSDYIQVDPVHGTGTAEANLDKNKVPHWKITENKAFDYINKDDATSELLSKSDVLYYGTLAQRGDTSRETIQSLFGKERIYFCDLNLRQNFFSRKVLLKSLEAATILKVNEDELRQIHNMFLEGNYNRRESAEAVRIKFNIELLSVTLGAEGAYLFKNGETNFYTINIKNVVDTTGAGDAYSAMLLLGYLNKWDTYQINKLASELAGEIIQVTSALPKDDAIYQHFKTFIENN